MSSEYEKLEATIPTYEALRAIPVVESNEPFVAIDTARILTGYMPGMEDMKEILGNTVLVRQGVFARLLKAQECLSATADNLKLFVTYGYRSLEIQTKRFNALLEKTRAVGQYADEAALYNEVHRFIAVPVVAGHPTGGAVDITIKDLTTGEFLDFGSKQYDYSTKDCYVFVDTISEEAKTNRLMLRNCMQEAGFAPFDGEWWHFSYGDRDWACYYKKPQALYGQIAYDAIETLRSS